MSLRLKRWLLEGALDICSLTNVLAFSAGPMVRKPAPKPPPVALTLPDAVILTAVDVPGPLTVK